MSREKNKEGTEERTCAAACYYGDEAIDAEEGVGVKGNGGHGCVASWLALAFAVVVEEVGKVDWSCGSAFEVLETLVKVVALSRCRS